MLANHYDITLWTFYLSIAIFLVCTLILIQALRKNPKQKKEKQEPPKTKTKFCLDNQFLGFLAGWPDKDFPDNCGNCPKVLDCYSSKSLKSSGFGRKKKVALTVALWILAAILAVVIWNLMR